MSVRRTIKNLFLTPSYKFQPSRKLRVEQLEDREVPTVTLLDIPDQEIFTDRPLYIPVTTKTTDTGNVTVTATSGNPLLDASVVAGGRSVRFTISGTDNTGTAFTGTITIRLFESAAPLATSEIINLVNSGFYNNKLFHRVIDNFVIQGGSPTGNGQGGSTLPDVADEFRLADTFASKGIVAMANAGDDNNNSQFFITDIDLPIASRPNHLNYNHTIVGIMTEGYDVYQKIITTPVNGSTPISNVTITGATVITDTKNSVVLLTPKAGYTGIANITVQASDGVGAPTTDTFALTGVNYATAVAAPANDRAFLGPVANLNTSTNTSVSFTPTFFNRETTDSITVRVGTPGTTSKQPNIFTTPANVSVSVDANNKVTITPAAGFTGTVDLLVGVWDNITRGGNSATDEFDTQKVTLTVSTGPTATIITLTSSKSSIGVNRSVLLTGTVTGPAIPTGTVQFFEGSTAVGTVTVVDGKALFYHTPATVAPQTYTAKFTPTNAAEQVASDSNSVSVNITAGTAPVSLRAQGTGAGVASKVTVNDAQGNLKFTITPFEASFTGGVRVAVGDINNDGQDDVVVVPAFGGGPVIRGYDGTNGNQILNLLVFESIFLGGLSVDVGDALGKGYAQILVGAGKTGGPRVTLFDLVQNDDVFNYFAYDSNLRGGVFVDLVQLRAGGQTQMITDAGIGGGPVVAIWNGYKPAVIDGQTAVKFGQFFAGASTNTAGIRSGEGDVKANGRRDIIVGPLEPESAALSLTFDPYTLGVFTN